MRRSRGEAAGGGGGLRYGKVLRTLPSTQPSTTAPPERQGTKQQHFPLLEGTLDICTKLSWIFRE